MRGVSSGTRRLAVVLLLAVIFSTGSALAAARDSQRDQSWLQTAKAWIAKRVPHLIVSFGDKLTIPPG